MHKLKGKLNMAFTKPKTTQNEFLVSYLRGTGREITAAQASATFGIKNIRARVAELRQAGFRVASRKNYRGAAAYKIASRLQNGSRASVEI